MLGSRLNGVVCLFVGVMALAVAATCVFAQDGTPQVGPPAGDSVQPIAIAAPHDAGYDRSLRGGCEGDLDADVDVDSSDMGILLADWGCPDDDPGRDGEPSDALEFRVVTVGNSSVQAGDDEYAPGFNGGVTYFTFDLVVTVPDGDDWMVTLAQATLARPEVAFFQHPLGDDCPIPNFFPYFPALRFDCWYTTPTGFPNTDEAPQETGFTEIKNQDRHLRACWFDTANTAAGDFTIARYTLVFADDRPRFPSIVTAGTGGRAPIIGKLTATSKVGRGGRSEFAFDIVYRCAGDLDGDRDVDQSDLGILLAALDVDAGGDLDSDGDTDQADLSILLATQHNICDYDCNGNGIPDFQDIADGTSEDCNENRIPDHCEQGWKLDCNENGAPDFCDLYDGTSEDCNQNQIPDECEVGVTEDCNRNGVPDLCDIYSETSGDCNENGVPDECEVGGNEDCNENGQPDLCDIYYRTSQDLNNNGVPDECEGNHTWHVDDDAPNDPGSGDPETSDPNEDGSTGHPFDAIQEAIDHCIHNDVVLVADGVYTGLGNKHLDCGGRRILVTSANGPDTSVIDVEGDGRGFHFHSRETTATRVNGFTITNGYLSDDNGAGVYCERYSSPTIANCVMKGNSAHYCGGAMYCHDGSSPVVIDCVITNNTAGGQGGGVSCRRSSYPQFTDCIISGNAADNGGGVHCWMSSPRFFNCVISGNYGGGVLGHAWAFPRFVNCLVVENAGGLGGGMRFTFGAGARAVNCVISGNTGYKGGALYVEDAGATLINCTITGNTASEGGAIYSKHSDPTISNCTITGNTASDVGGALRNVEVSHPQIANCVLWADYPQEIAGGWTTVWYSDVEGGCDGEGNIDADPLFADSDGPDDDPDTWEDNDCRLGGASPCIDAADNEAVLADVFDLDEDGDAEEPIPFDLDGNPRFVDDPNTPDTGNGTPPIVDMGVYEFQLPGCAGDRGAHTDVGQVDVAILIVSWACLP